MTQDSDTQAASPERNDEAILTEARARFRVAQDAESKNRLEALDDLRFRAGEQWPTEIKADRDFDGRPCLVINRIPQFIQQVTNDQRQNRPSIKVHPVDDRGDPDVAEVIQGMIRHIEYDSNADVAYDTAFDSAVTGGFGYLRVITDYENPLSFEQKILIKRVRNPFSVFFDPYSQEPDGSDANFALIVEDLSPEEYRAQYPNSELSSMSDWTALGNTAPGWAPSGKARVAEYYYRETKTEKIAQLSSGQTVLKRKLPKDANGKIVLPDGITIVRERDAQVPVIRWCKLNGHEILEKTDWLGRWIPIVPVYGNELDIDGQRILEGIVRNARDSQRMYNYWASAETEAIALAPRAPFIGYEGQFEGFEAQWKTANRRNHAYLEVKATMLNGQPAPLPQRNTFEPAVQAITQARMIAADDLKATTGIYDAAMGAKSNETSGVAIQRRNIQAQTSNFHFIDNLTRSLRHTGRILIDLIPKIYDTPRAARIIGEDGDERIVRVNDPEFEEGGKKVLYRLDTGQYDVTVDVGPSFASKRQEAVASMLELSKAVPGIAQAAADLMVKNMDWPGAQDIAERLKKTLPPGLADDPKEGEQKIPPQVAAQMQQMGQMVEQLSAQLNEAKDVISTKRMELESKERIESMKIDADLRKTLMTIDSREGVELLKQEILAVNRRLDLLDFNAPVNAEPGASGAGVDPSLESTLSSLDGAALGADVEQDEPGVPTGGLPPGQPMEGNP